jgi:hypothetical protein
MSKIQLIWFVLVLTCCLTKDNTAFAGVRRSNDGSQAWCDVCGQQLRGRFNGRYVEWEACPNCAKGASGSQNTTPSNDTYEQQRRERAEREAEQKRLEEKLNQQFLEQDRQQREEYKRQYEQAQSQQAVQNATVAARLKTSWTSNNAARTGLDNLFADDAPKKKKVPASGSTNVASAELDRLRIDLYKAQADQREIGQVYRDMAVQFSAVVAATDEITKRNKEALIAIAFDSLSDSIKARSKVTDLSSKMNDIKENIEGYKKIENFKSVDEGINQSMTYLRQVSDTLDDYCKTFKIGVKGYEGWKDVFQEAGWIRQLPELEIKNKALALDAQEVKGRIQTLILQIEKVRDEIVEKTHVEKSSIAVSPLRPPGLGAYVPRIYPTGESIQKIKDLPPSKREDG